MSFFRFASACRSGGVGNVGIAYRYMSQAAQSSDIRARLMTELKSAMKSKDTVKSVTIRSVLAEVYAADKSTDGLAPSSTIVSIIRKGAQRRIDSAAEFEKAARADLAEKERNEAQLLQVFLPPLLPEADIDKTLQEIISEQKLVPGDGNSRKAIGAVFKQFYARVDRSLVDTDLVKRRAEALLANP